ncbi:MAG TPA: hypothetical protein VGR35_08060 [Tepidisphaeraceae bacterium]|nr:hypothetical protein [Tepidisphaeraceae bacterium]
MKRKKAKKPILRKITITIGGKHVRTVRQRITLRQAIRECGDDRWHSKGEEYHFTAVARRLVRVRFSYLAAEELIDDLNHCVDMNTGDAVMIIRKGFVG